MSSLTISGPTNLSIAAGDSTATAQYTANKSGVTWSVSVLSDGVLGPLDYTVSISPSGVLTVELAPGVTIPPTGVDLVLRVGAQRGGGGGQGNTDTLDVTVSIAPGVVPCFVAGTLIRTLHGEMPVEDLRVGDMVVNRHGRPRPITWIGSRYLSGRQLTAAPNLAPIRIQKDAFGPGRPYADLLVSPQHRVMVEGWCTELLVGQDAALAHAVHLVDGRRITKEETDAGVHYWHFCLQDHDIVWSNGLCSETLLVGRMAVRAYDAQSAAELMVLFPELFSGRKHSWPKACLPVAARHEARAIARTMARGSTRTETVRKAPPTELFEGVRGAERLSATKINRR